LRFRAGAGQLYPFAPNISVDLQQRISSRLRIGKRFGCEFLVIESQSSCVIKCLGLRQRSLLDQNARVALFGQCLDLFAGDDAAFNLASIRLFS
jgi:hypothetical protein